MLERRQMCGVSEENQLSYYNGNYRRLSPQTPPQRLRRSPVRDLSEHRG